MHTPPSQRCPILYLWISRALHYLSLWSWYPSSFYSALSLWLLLALNTAAVESARPSGSRGSLAGVDIVERSAFALIWKVALVEARILLRHHCSTNDPFAVGNIFRAEQSAMDLDATPRGPSTKALGLMRTSSSSSFSSYPCIPRRSSSLFTSTDHSSDEQPTSTRTPSFSSSLYQIEMPKKRQEIQHGFQYTRGSLNNSLEDPFSDNMIPETPTKLQRHDQRLRRQKSHMLTIRWSSGSFSNSTSNQTENLPGSPGELNSSLEPTDMSGERTSWENSQYLCPMKLPVAFVSLQTVTSRPKIGFGTEHVLTTIHVSANVSSVPLPEASSLAPLDILLLLDASLEMSDNLLSQFSLASTILASRIIQGYDRIGLAYVSGEAAGHFQLLLPLGFRSLDEIRAALNVLPRRAQFSSQKGANVGVAIQEISKVFNSSSRIATCHLFLIASMLPANYSVPWIDHAIGFHTITPQSSSPLVHMNNYPGWHIYYDLGAQGTIIGGRHLSRRVAGVLRHIRAGLRPGCLDQVKIVLTPGPGCQIEPATKVYQIASLRPGEIWNLPVSVIVPVAFETTDKGDLQELPRAAMETIIGINKFLMGWVSDLPEHILTVQVEYHHSLLPTNCTVNLQSHVTSIRSRRTDEEYLRPSIMSVQPGESFIFTRA